MTLHKNKASSPAKPIDWDHHLRRWQALKISQSAYCQQNGLNRAQFSYWKCKRLGSAKRLKEDQSQPSNFVPLTSATPSLPCTGAELIVTLPNGYQLSGITQDTLRIAQALLKELTP